MKAFSTYFLHENYLQPRDNYLSDALVIKVGILSLTMFLWKVMTSLFKLSCCRKISSSLTDTKLCKFQIWIILYGTYHAIRNDAVVLCVTVKLDLKKKCSNDLYMLKVKILQECTCMRLYRVKQNIEDDAKLHPTSLE